MDGKGGLSLSVRRLGHRRRRSPKCSSQPPGSIRGTKLQPHHTGSYEQLVKTSIQGEKGKLNAAGEQQREQIVTTGDGLREKY